MIYKLYNPLAFFPVLYIMDDMLGNEQNLRDTNNGFTRGDSPVSNSLISPLGDYSVYYTKINKLITALYMVTDIMDKDEPIRLKLRTYGVDVLSDITCFNKDTFIKIDEKISAILSFLNIANDLRMVSEMNSNILKKEFVELKGSIQEFIKKDIISVENYLSKPSENIPLPASIDRWMSKGSVESFKTSDTKSDIKTNVLYKGHQVPRPQGGTRIGVQKAGNLLNALSKVSHTVNKDFEVLKNGRREKILEIVKKNSNGISIKDIATELKNIGEIIGDKTLQRELVSMIKDNVLKKTGEKRWSLYFVF